jgi:hypothetical protein
MRDEKGVGPVLDHGSEGRIDFPFVSRAQEIDLLANGTRAARKGANATADAL